MEIFDNGDEVLPPTDALTFLRSVYQCPAVPLHVRMRAAQIALPFEKPALKAMASVVVGDDFARRLEKAVAQSQATKAIEAPKVSDLEI